MTDSKRCRYCECEDLVVCDLTITDVPTLALLRWPVECRECGSRQFGPALSIAMFLLRNAIGAFPNLRLRLHGSIARTLTASKRQAAPVAEQPPQFHHTVRPTVVPEAVQEPLVHDTVGSWLWQVGGRNQVEA